MPRINPWFWVFGVPLLVAAAYWVTVESHFLQYRELKHIQSWKMPGKPYALDLSDKKELYITDLSSEIWVYSLTGVQQRKFSIGFSDIRGIRLNNANPQEVFIAKTISPVSIVVTNQSGFVKRSITAKIPNSDTVVPHGFAFLPNGDFVVSDNTNKGLIKFDSNEKLIGRIGKVGGSNGEFERTRQIKYNSKNKYLYVADRDNNRIQVVDLNGKFVQTFGDIAGSNGGKLNQPHGVALDIKQELVYVGDTYNERIVVYDFAGNFIDEYKDPAFTKPRWMVVDQSTGRLYVTSYPAQAVGVFEIEWKY